MQTKHKYTCTIPITARADVLYRALRDAKTRALCVAADAIPAHMTMYIYWHDIHEIKNVNGHRVREVGAVVYISDTPINSRVIAPADPGAIDPATIDAALEHIDIELRETDD